MTWRAIKIVLVFAALFAQELWHEKRRVRQMRKKATSKDATHRQSQA